ncbi:MAG TPA: hypothetical protein VL614_21200 [Acetobacteraceae bacterium]|nr:hypothetical protein [Acetobacteraceae bacterium]
MLQAGTSQVDDFQRTSVGLQQLSWEMESDENVGREECLLGGFKVPPGGNPDVRGDMRMPCQRLGAQPWRHVEDGRGAAA